MPVSTTTGGGAKTGGGAFRQRNDVGTRDEGTFFRGSMAGL